MEQLLSSPLCGILVSIVCFRLGIETGNRINSPLVNRVATANIILILILLFTPLTIEQYLPGGNILAMFIVPVTVILALKIYRQRAQLAANIIPILGACITGSAASLFSVWVLCKRFGVERTITVSLLPKSVTTAIALELSQKNGGIAGLTVSMVIITGMVSCIFAPVFIKLFKLNDPLAAGIAIGVSGHAIGTTTAIELGETQGAMSGLAMGITGIITSVFYVFLF
jgi:putative effector of murein hydrolase